MSEQKIFPINVFLASGSPRRRQLLQDAGVSFTVFTGSTEVDESLDQELAAVPFRAAQKLAERKAGAVVQELITSKTLTERSVVIGADTMVVLDNEIFGKPENDNHAREMLSRLAGKTHEVITGVSVWTIMISQSNEDDHSDSSVVDCKSFAEVSHVTFKELSAEDIDDYIATGETTDKAGAYAIQGYGASLIQEYEGDYNNIVGLPVDALLKKFPELLFSHEHAE